MSPIAFSKINWQNIEKIKYNGTTGFAHWQTAQYDGLRIRLVEYSANYLADHWCKKGHVVHCLEGEFASELSTGEKDYFKAGDTYIVTDDASSHRSISENGVRLLIIDGDFLQ